MSKIPKPVLNVLGASGWTTDDRNLNGYDTTLSSHQPLDERDGNTAAYIYRAGGDCPDGRFDHADIKALSSQIPDGMLADEGTHLRVNQYFAHSLGQFMANCQHQWNLHLQRMESVKDTASGRIWSDDKAS
jgi:hypothetical protein